MGKKDLKKQYPDLDLNFVDLISLLDTTPTKKITPFLVREFYKHVQFTPNELKKSNQEFESISKTLGSPKNTLDEFMKTIVFNWVKSKLDIIEDFTEHMENNRLKENDINRYDSWEQIQMAVTEAELKLDSKSKKNRIQKIYDDGEEWLVIKPLSIEASVNYGYGTKWCTSMNADNTFFHRYSREGVLLFVINRKNGLKYAFYSSPREYSVWTSTDARIDSMETKIPFDLLVKIKDWTDFDKVGPNYDYFDDEDKFGLKVKKLRLPDEIIATIRQQREEDEILAVSVEGPPLEDYENDGMVELSEPVEETRPTRILSEQHEEMVGYGHPVHGSITEQGERTWSDPYPNGPGGGFELNEAINDLFGVDVPDEMPEEVMNPDYGDELPEQAG